MTHGPVARAAKRQLTSAAARLLCAAFLLCLAASLVPSLAADKEAAPMKHWQVGTPIVTYWAGPAMTDAVAKQMADGGFNLVWCTEKELDVAQRHGLRAMLHGGPVAPSSLDTPEQRAQLDAYIDRVKSHPALYCYFITDEPSAATFPAWGKLFAYLRERDPAHMAYLNLLPTYATNEQLGTKGDVVTAYKEHLRQYIDVVKPELLSWDHYQFMVGGRDTGQYFLNLALIREASQKSGIPFLNIVQAASWEAGVRVPTPDEVRYLVYTTLAYGAQGISYYVYCCGGHTGMIANADGSPTALYGPLCTMNREFAAIAAQLQPLKSLTIYQAGMLPEACVALPANAPFRFDPPVAPMAYAPPAKVKGLMLAYFGTPGKPTHVLAVNLDYEKSVKTSVVGPGALEVFNPKTGAWKASPNGARANMLLMPGGGKLLRVVE